MLPEGFLKRAEALLGEEYADFIGSLEGEAVRGLRANLIKTNTATVSGLFGDALTPIPYRLNGFIIDGEVRIGRTPEHHSGMIYVQDPGAMAALCATEIKPDFKVLDVCAAPGGKSSGAARQGGLSSLQRIRAEAGENCRRKLRAARCEKRGRYLA